MTRLDENRARAKSSRNHPRHQHDDLGKSLSDAVSGFLQCEDRQQAGRRSDRRGKMVEGGFYRGRATTRARHHQGAAAFLQPLRPEMRCRTVRFLTTTRRR